MKKILMGVDCGDVRTGIAVSDALGIMALGVGTFKASGRKALIGIVIEQGQKYNVDEFVVGNPINMNGTIGERSLKAQKFATELEAESGKPVHLFDERCTTMVAHSIMNLTDTRGKKRKENVDTLSAQIILQNYMDSHKNDLDK
jgi:putative Holliday junction resolvase